MPSASIRCAISEAIFASPIITGMIAWPAPASVKPAADMPSRKRAWFARRRARSSSPDSSRSRHAIEAAAIAGISVFEKRYGRLRWRSHSTISFRPEV